MAGFTDVLIPTLKTREAVQPLVDEIERTAGVPVKVFASCTQASASVNRNLCLEQATSPVVIQCDDDVTGFRYGWVARLLEIMEQCPNCVMASPRLIKPDGTLGLMMGVTYHERTGIEIVGTRKLPTACVAMRNDGLRFFEGFTGSGWEDDDIARQLCDKYPQAEFIVDHDLRVVHRNEMKNQHGDNWKHNEAVFHQRWEKIS